MKQVHFYLSDTYCFTKTGRIISKGRDEYGYWIMLDQNIFHPQGGGQPADIGFINNIPVRVKKNQLSDIVLYFESSHDFKLGQVVNMEIASDKRLHHAALHTGGHLLNDLLHSYGWIAQSGHHFPNESRVEFIAQGLEATPVDKIKLEEIKEKIDQCIYQDGIVEIWYEGEIRYCKIQGTEAIPCAGTHVSSLGKITNFTIKAIKFKKNTLRISYDCSHIDMS